MKLLQSRSINVKITSGYAVLLVLIVIMGVMGYFGLRTTNTIVNRLAEVRLPAIDRLVQADRDLNQLLVAERSMIFTNVKDETFKELVGSYEQNMQQSEERVSFFKKIMRTEKERALLENYEKARGEWKELSRKVVEGRKEDTREGRRLAIDLTLKDANTAFENMRGYLDELQNVNLTLAEEERVESNRSFNRLTLLWIILITASTIAGLLLAFFIGRSIIVPVRKAITELESGSDALSTASRQLSSSSQTLSESSSEQASSLEEISSSLEEMASMIKQNTDNTQQADTLSQEANKATAKSTEAMSRMNGAITKIKTSSDETAKIIKTIDEIAMQTNLLALNAAVEAARAGEAGRGFAVVAEEVRNLAQRSAEAAKSTASLIEESRKNSEEGVVYSQEVNESLLDISEKVQKVNQLIAEVAMAGREQTEGIDQVNTAVARMDTITQGNAANAEESASSSEELSSQTVTLGGIVTQLLGVVEGQKNNNRFLLTDQS